MPKRGRTDSVGDVNPGDRGPQPYTDEPTKRTTTHLLDEVYRAMRVDGIGAEAPFQALMIELSREYLDSDVRARVLRRVYERLGREWPG
jgi:hypothetical protein